MSMSGVSVTGSVSLLRATSAGPDVIEVDGPEGFCASVFRHPHGRPVLRLNIAIRGAAHEGDVLRWALLHCSTASPDGLYIYDLERASGTD